ncbi:iron chaperone [Microbacterium sp. NPDC091662]|uniref:iron chaperone n=1 Tax=Microbacterium sp. NPDC091662 TaxID=3364211 RepID=UPI0037F5D965
MGTIDDYLAALAAADREAIDRVYAVARQEAPDAEQGTGYGMPALVYRGKALLSVMRAKKHIGIYPFSPDAVAAVAGLLDGLPGISVDKGTIRFQPEHPIRLDVLESLVRTRLAQIDEA